jgi:hypothetical protein
MPGLTGFRIRIAAVVPVLPELLHVVLREQPTLVLLTDGHGFLSFGLCHTPWTFVADK